MHGYTAHAAHGLQRRAQFVDAGWRFPVSRLAPALCAADHATGNHLQIRLGIEPVAARLVKGQFETVTAELPRDQPRRGWQLHDARAQCALFQYMAMFAKSISTK